jgi:cytochrome c-type biogenesis protein CcmH
MNILKVILSFFLLLMLSSQAYARFEAHDFKTPQMEEDYGVLVQELRCLVCQNQNLADSNAELAQDMRLRVYKMLNEGSSKEDVVQFMVQRYGDFVMYRPPVKKSTFLLWFGPILFFVVAGAMVASFIRRQKSESVEPVDEQQQKKASSFLDD